LRDIDAVFQKIHGRDVSRLVRETGRSYRSKKCSSKGPIKDILNKLYLLLDQSKVAREAVELIWESQGV
jgi:hypothetical protein